MRTFETLIVTKFDHVLQENLVRIIRKTTRLALLGIHFDIDLQNTPRLNHDHKLVILKGAAPRFFL
jgi:hypothetical protein